MRRMLLSELQEKSLWVDTKGESDAQAHKLGSQVSEYVRDGDELDAF